MTYTPPIAEQRFVLETIARIDEIRALPGFEAATPDLVEAVLTEAGKLASGMFAPLNETGDRIGSKAIDGAVATPAGFRAAYDAYAEGGWIGLGAVAAPRVDWLGVFPTWQTLLAQLLVIAGVALTTMHTSQKTTSLEKTA